MTTREVFETAKAAGDADRAWCASAVLVACGEANAAEKAFHDRWKPAGLQKARAPMLPPLWDSMRLADEDRAISDRYASSWSEACMTHATPHKEFGVKRKKRVDLRKSPLILCKLLAYVVDLLDVPCPEVFILEEKRSLSFEAINAADDDELCLGLLVRPYQLEGKTERDIAFLLGRQLALFRPEYLAAWAVPGVDARWARAVNAAACRVGLLVCGDVEAALRHVSLADGADLLAFAVGEAYGSARKKLGFAIGDAHQ